MSDQICKKDLWEEYYTNLHKAYDAMWQTFADSGLSEDQISEKLGVNKSIISNRLDGSEELTLMILSSMASAMKCRLSIKFVPYDEIQKQEA